MEQVTVIEGCAIATVDDERRELADGHIVVEGDRIAAVGAGPAPRGLEPDLRIDGRGKLATPGLVNCHHHLYQWATRGYAQQSTLFEWLVALYPVWQHIDAATVDAAARAGLAALARSGCTTSTDHHYIFPARAGDLLEVEIAAARAIGLRFHPCRGAMDLGRSQGGLPPDDVVEDRDAILAASAEAIDRFHDPAPGAMVRIALAPTSPFSVTGELMRETAELARARGVRLHTHLAETDDEEVFCLERFGVRPLEYVESLGWLGDDVWLAHCVHLNADEAARMGATGTGVAHCPTSNGRLGAGIAPVPALLRAGAPVGLGVDGAASNECGELVDELRAALVLARVAHGPAALTARDALELATRHGARCLGREDELGHLSPGALADIALWELDEPGFAGIADPVAALAFGPTRPVHTLLVGGRAVVDGGELRTADPVILAADLARESARLAP
ncbi:MAG TPA: 8-oxoguanine deaminase [Solirubrobacteraceae bacterium]|nr:8-oxoguanine deaminase [Solirubrobacteraceae bacterium]